MNKKWSDIVERWKDSVLQIIVHKATYDITRPYSNPNDIKSRGTGFIIDIKRGLVVTNAHVVENSINILGRSPLNGKMNLNLKLVGISKDRDLAICQLSTESRIFLCKKITIPERLNMKFGDNMKLNQSEEVITIGYPLGKENIKVTNGIVSGFQYDGDHDQNKLGLENPSFIQITAAINPGNSGGPLLNKEGEVVGINAAGYLFAQNIGYAIGSRTLLSIFEHMLSSDGIKILNVPKFSFKWNKTNPTLNNAICGNPDHQGIYVRDVWKDSVFDNLEEGNIVTAIIYQDPFWEDSEAFNVTNVGMNDNSLLTRPYTLIYCDIDNYGDVTIYQYDETNKKDYRGRKLLNRKMELNELKDIIPIGAYMALYVCRGSNDNQAPQWNAIENNYNISSIPRISWKYIHFDPIPYLLFSGLIVSNLCINHIQDMRKDHLKEYVKKDKAFESFLVIVKVFPDTSVYDVGTLKEGDVLDEINYEKVRSIEDLYKSVKNTSDFIYIKTLSKKFFIMNKSKFIEEDMKIIKDYKITDHNYILT